jgi:glycosyltransferase involved in cell wall biosynthesis
MRIFMASALDPKDRGAQSLKETLKAYTEKGHEVFFVTYKKHKKDPNYFYENKKHLGLKNFHYYSVKLPLSFLMGVPVLRRIVTSVFYPIMAVLKFREMTHGNVDILYGYEVSGVLACALIQLFRKLPVVSRFQGTVLYTYLGKWGIIKYLDHVLAFKCPSDLIIMTNDGTRGDVVLGCFGAGTDKVRFWINGVDKGLNDPQYKNWISEKYKLSRSTKVLLTLSRLVDWKRVDRAIRVLKYVSGKVNAVLVIVGDGPEKENLVSLAKKEGVADKVIFANSVTHAEVKKYLNSCDVFLSLYDLSNLGNPVLEAMSCGRCVVALDRGEMKDIIEDGRDGVLVKFENRGSAGSVVLDLLNNEEKKSAIGKDALAKSKKDFWSWEERMATEVEEVTRVLE